MSRDQILADRRNKAACLERLMQDTENVCKRQTPEARAALLAAAQFLIENLSDDDFSVQFQPQDDWYGGSILRIVSRLGPCQVHYKGDGTLNHINTSLNSKIRGCFENMAQLRDALERFESQKAKTE